MKAAMTLYSLWPRLQKLKMVRMMKGLIVNCCLIESCWSLLAVELGIGLVLDSVLEQDFVLLPVFEPQQNSVV